MSLILLKADELRRALADIEAAEKNGFMHCEAVMEPDHVNGMGHLTLRYSDLMELADPINPALNWGRFQNVTKRNRFVDGRLIPIQWVHSINTRTDADVEDDHQAILEESGVDRD